MDSIEGNHWNHLVGDNNPFLRHEFLAALEQTGCVGPGTGWLPCHISVHHEGALVAAIPMYCKLHSFGEFVFDWSWADAYEAGGRHYYPKLVAAVPFTPVTGPRILHLPGIMAPQAIEALLNAALRHAQEIDASSIHVLFPDGETRATLAGHGYVERIGFQYHWRNQAYRDFADFMDNLKARKRKKIRHERQTVRDQSVSVDVLRGSEIDVHHWDEFYRFYASTVRRKGQWPSLTLEFFRTLGFKMKDDVLLIMARRRNEYVAAAFFMLGDQTMYGRYWGCREFLPGLHFEVCYYRAIEYCIQHGLQRLEGGAQGEHKLSRGFEPVLTYSEHYFRDADFHSLIDNYLDRERPLVVSSVENMRGNAPYRVATKDASRPENGRHEISNA